MPVPTLVRSSTRRTRRLVCGLSAAAVLLAAGCGDASGSDAVGEATPTGAGTSAATVDAGRDAARGATTGADVATLLADDPAVPLDVRRHGVRRRGAVRILDITYAVPGGDRVEAYLVTPGGAGPFAGVVFAHLYAPTRADADRTQFLDEAVALARRGTVGVLPQGTFPYREPPTDATHDLEALARQAVALRRALDVAVGVRGVDPARLGYVGHDYGAMYGTAVASADRRVRALALIAPSPRWATWFLQYWSAGIDDPEAYGAALSPLDPRLLLRETRAAVLLQLGRGDTFVPDEDAEALRGAVPPQSEVRLYDGGHEPGQPARRDRERWLADRLGLPAAR